MEDLPMPAGVPPASMPELPTTGNIVFTAEQLKSVLASLQRGEQQSEQNEDDISPEDAMRAIFNAHKGGPLAISPDIVHDFKAARAALMEYAFINSAANHGDGITSLDLSNPQQKKMFSATLQENMGQALADDLLNYDKLVKHGVTTWGQLLFLFFDYGRQIGRADDAARLSLSTARNAERYEPLDAQMSSRNMVLRVPIMRVLETLMTLLTARNLRLHDALDDLVIIARPSRSLPPIMLAASTNKNSNPDCVSFPMNLLEGALPSYHELFDMLHIALKRMSQLLGADMKTVCEKLPELLQNVKVTLPAAAIGRRDANEDDELKDDRALQAVGVSPDIEKMLRELATGDDVELDIDDPTKRRPLQYLAVCALVLHQLAPRLLSNQGRKQLMGKIMTLAAQGKELKDEQPKIDKAMRKLLNKNIRRYMASAATLTGTLSPKATERWSVAYRLFELANRCVLTMMEPKMAIAMALHPQQIQQQAQRVLQYTLNEIRLNDEEQRYLAAYDAGPAGFGWAPMMPTSQTLDPQEQADEQEALLTYMDSAVLSRVFAKPEEKPIRELLMSLYTDLRADQPALLDVLMSKTDYAARQRAADADKDAHLKALTEQLRTLSAQLSQREQEVCRLRQQLEEALLDEPRRTPPEKA